MSVDFDRYAQEGNELMNRLAEIILGRITEHVSAGQKKHILDQLPSELHPLLT